MRAHVTPEVITFITIIIFCIYYLYYYYSHGVLEGKRALELQLG